MGFFSAVGEEHNEVSKIPNWSWGGRLRRNVLVLVKLGQWIPVFSSRH